MLNPTNEIRDRAGYKKIQKCAEFSREVWDCDFTWVDTCCIDKTSSSELSESINSMYAWYRDSHICFAYLEDFHGENITQLAREMIHKHTRWFTRGWTLQELIAPEEVIFFSASWKRIGNKQWHLPILESITGIDQSILKTRKLQDVSVAERMKWVACRKTTRKEDLAYCMLGIFEVNMPLIYGEADKAFLRLQHEIMRNSDDVTIFLWSSSEKHPSTYRGALARHPIEFVRSTAPKAPMYVLDEPFQMTNKGLQITTPLTKLDQMAPDDIMFLAKDPHYTSLFLLSFDQRGPQHRIVTHHVVLRKIKVEKHQYIRVYPGFQFIAARQVPTTQPEPTRAIEKTIMIVGRLTLSEVDVYGIVPCRGLRITEMIHIQRSKYANGSVREFKSKPKVSSIGDTYLEDSSELEALYCSDEDRQQLQLPRLPLSNRPYKSILLRYQGQCAKVQLFILDTWRLRASGLDKAAFRDAVLQAVRNGHYPPRTPTFISNDSRPEGLRFLTGTANLRENQEINERVGTEEVYAKFSWTTSDDSVFLDVALTTTHTNCK
ncbi:Vegetative incompatibility protein HET-E-1 [Colletotrichum siamense]|uniref:Vegetative incompatibility protein HET-E-1 n=1 Tax=Colletotrichum siamense TaxID=690259 RepID=UPI00187257BF|nr:Vegetative incompatibility protein HET-E-1 [Colletotrichum siamense]KAF5494268.1 Vegetative incompatibility protein HET-E-1 [Colletotrichum siamense]